MNNLTSKEEKLQRDAALLNLTGKISDKVLDLLKEFIRGSISNPLLGTASSIIIADVLSRTGILSQEAKNIIFVAVGAIDASSIVDGIIASLNPLKSSTSEMMPSASTVVFGDSTGTSKLEGLVESKGKVKK